MTLGVRSRPRFVTGLVPWRCCSWRRPLSIQADLLNAFDTLGVYNIQSVFGGTHVIPPRTLAVRVRYRLGGKS